MPNLETLPATKLHALIAKLDAAHSALLSETIAAGYGEVRHNEIVRLAREERYPLLVEYVEAYEALQAPRSELDARRRYQGNDRPIKRRMIA